MAEAKKVLVIGGTGAMGVYLVPELLARGFEVDVASLDDVRSTTPNLGYIQADCKDDAVMTRLLKKGYDAIVDFLIYSTADYRRRHKLLLDNTNHLIYLSSYRIYADSAAPITEDSPRLLDVSTDREFLATNDYSLEKARGEDILRNSPYRHWTIVRPSITFSQRRFQLVTLEANTVIARARAGKAIVLPEEAMGVQGTMTWAGDVAKMLSRLTLNEAAMGEAYTLATAEHNPWRVVADYYKELIGLRAVTISAKDYVGLIAGEADSRHVKWQLELDRLFNRVVDNSKVLKVTGLKQSELMPVKDALRRELAALPADVPWTGDDAVNARMDAYLKDKGL